MNPLKFSRNYEASLLLNRLNLGFSTEGNLVWSSESQMPRSISGNFTVDLFGQSINMIDFGARLEGLEYVVKKMFGGSEEGSPKVSICNRNIIIVAPLIPSILKRFTLPSLLFDIAIFKKVFYSSSMKTYLKSFDIMLYIFITMYSSMTQSSACSYERKSFSIN